MSEKILNTKIYLKNYTTAGWAEHSDKVLHTGEIGIEYPSSGAPRVKIGDGVKTWANLPYFAGETEIAGAGNTIVSASFSDGKLTLTKGDRVASISAADETIVVDSTTAATPTIKVAANKFDAYGAAAAEATRATGVEGELSTRIQNLEARGRFLSNWNATTGLPETYPTPTEYPYTYPYKSGDYYIVSVVPATGTKYQPSGSEITKESAEAEWVIGKAEDAREVGIGDYYTYDGTRWVWIQNSQKTVSFQNIAGDAYDNTNLSGALNAKQNAITADAKLSADLVADGSANHVFTAEDDTKLAGIAAGAQVNVIETVKVNGTALDITDKAVNIDLSGKVDKVANKSLVADSEITKLAGVSAGANKVEASTTNGKIKIDGTETTVYDESSLIGGADTEYNTLKKLQDKVVAAQTTASSKQDAITSSNKLSSDLVDDASHTNKFVTAEQITKLAGIEAGAQVNKIESVDTENFAISNDANKKLGIASGKQFVSTAQATKIDAIAVNETAKSVTDGTNTISNIAIDASYVHTDNNFTSALKGKLENVEAGAQVNVIEKIKVGTTEQSVADKTVSLGTAAGANVATVAIGTAEEATDALPDVAKIKTYVTGEIGKLGQALHYIGATNLVGSETIETALARVVTAYQGTHPGYVLKAGAIAIINVASEGSREYIYDGTNWQEIGSEGLYATKAELSNLAGEGRGTETVVGNANAIITIKGTGWVDQTIKGNADAIAALAGKHAEGKTVAQEVADGIAALDATASQTASTDGLALSITEVDGKITAISGSIAANTYDAYNAASTVKTELIDSATTDYNTLGKLETAVKAAIPAPTGTKTDGQLLTWDGTNNKWINKDAPATGVLSVAAGDNSIAVGGTAANPTVAAKITTTQGNVTLSVESDGLKADVADEALSIAKVSGLQTALDAKVVANTAITGATKAKITYDAKGLVTAGADLEASDIPNLNLAKITDVTASATEVNYVAGVTSAIQTQLDGKEPVINASNKLNANFIDGLKTVAYSGSYTDLTNKPTLATVATSGSYTDLSNTPSEFAGSAAGLVPHLDTAATDKVLFSNGAWETFLDKVSVDGTSITKDTNKKLQTVGIIDQHGNGVKNLWTGTEAEYNALTEKHDNWIYIITDDSHSTRLPDLTIVGQVYNGSAAVTITAAQIKTALGIITANNLTIATDAWVDDSTYSTYGFNKKATVTVSGITAAHHLTIGLDIASMMSGVIAPFNTVTANTVTFYATSVPANTVTIDSLVAIL